MKKTDRRLAYLGNRSEKQGNKVNGSRPKSGRQGSRLATEDGEESRSYGRAADYKSWRHGRGFTHRRMPVDHQKLLKTLQNNCLFHLVQKDFLVQTGDPTGTGSGGESIYKFLYGEQARSFKDEILQNLKHDKVGVVAMASAGENLNASQFYITTRADLDYLNGKHTVFGYVVEGHEVLMKINEAFVDDKFCPYKNIRIKHTYVLDDPFEDPVQLAEFIPENSPVCLLQLRARK
ncbi:hypothetical protein L7F22_028983 [Adiantum nelumboides]|nr:hypothetical protein [Adiantum nelumboides]